jgi:DNA processing protein
MTHDPALASWLQLTLTPGLGAATLRKLLSQYGLPENVLAVRRADLAPYAGADALRALDSDAVARAVDQALGWLAQPGRAIVTLADAAYPRLLLEIADPPPLLYCHGRTSRRWPWSAAATQRPRAQATRSSSRATSARPA